MKVLLVEPYSKRKILPLSLMKLARFHHQQGNEVKYVKGEANFFSLDFQPDLICVTSLFTWDYEVVRQTIFSYLRNFPGVPIELGGVCATLLYDKFKKDFSNYPVKIHQGLDDFEQCLPMYEAFPSTNYFFGFTTRGCPNRCPFCMVWRHEPKYLEYENWEEQIIDKNFLQQKKKLILFDNNFLNSTEKHFQSVCEGLSHFKGKLAVDFNQGLDCQIFDRAKAKQLKKINLYYLRFAFDGLQEDGHFQKAVKLAREVGLKSDLRAFLLYNFNDTPEEVYYRIHEILKLKGKAFPMRYQYLNCLKRNEYVGKNWSLSSLKKFKNLYAKYYCKGMIFVDNQIGMDYFYKHFGKSPKEFRDIIESRLPKEQRVLNQY